MQTHFYFFLYIIVTNIIDFLGITIPSLNEEWVFSGKSSNGALEEKQRVYLISAL